MINSKILIDDKPYSEKSDNKITCLIKDKITSFKNFKGDFYNYGQINQGYKSEWAVVTVYLCEVIEGNPFKCKIGDLIEVLPSSIIKIIKD